MRIVLCPSCEILAIRLLVWRAFILTADSYHKPPVYTNNNVTYWSKSDGCYSHFAVVTTSFFYQ